MKIEQAGLKSMDSKNLNKFVLLHNLLKIIQVKSSRIEISIILKLRPRTMRYHFLLIISFLILFSACSSQKKEEKSYPEHVGNTQYDPQIDSAGFEPCHDDQIVEYYNFSKGLHYEGEKIALEKAFRENYEEGPVDGQTGYITIRFVVNCKAETGWFRIEAMDMDYLPKSFDKDIVGKLLSITQSLKGWKIGKFDDPGYENEVYDYYQYLTFKMENGQILEILP